MNVKRTVSVCGLSLLAVACRPDAGPSDYESQEPFFFDSDAGPVITDELPGPDPYEDGEDRLSIGAFYEGGFSEQVPVDEVTTHVYIYDETLRLVPDGERIEGLESIGVEHAGGAWWGCGVHWDFERDLSAWTQLRISFQSESATYDAVEIGMNDADGTYTVQASDYGWTPSGEWIHLTVPMSDLTDAGLDATAVIAPLVLLGDAGSNGDLLRVDAVYFTTD